MLKNLLRESFLYFLKKASKTAGNGNPEKILILEETELSYIFQETELSYTSGNATFLYFWKGIFRTLANLELEAYSEP